MFTQPSRLTFWRIILGIIPPAALLSLGQLWILAGKLNIAPLTSKSWLMGLGALALVAILSLGLLALTWSARREKVLDWLEAGAKISGPLRPGQSAHPAQFAGQVTGWMGLPVLLVALTGSSFILFHTYYGDLLRGQNYVRFFIFLLLALLGMNALKMLRPALSWPAAFLVTVLLQAAVYRILLYLPDISNYPFAMGWSETSRFYWPSLFVSPLVYGQRFPWPILHPSLHLLLVPPYLFDAPLWFHRFWQVAVRLLLVGLIAPALLYRLKLTNRALHWIFGVWIFVYLFTFQLYLHLAVPVLIMLWGFSAKNDRRTWIALIAASIWAGLSRLNWYPVPGILAVVLFLLEVPVSAKSSNAIRTMVKLLLWFLAGAVIAFATQRLYIALSGIPDASDFYTSLNSTLLWNRLWPNASYALGIVPGIALFSSPLWLVIGFSLWKRRSDWSPLRVCLIGLALLALFAGGIVVSLKIGGGADLHNMDAYAVVLLVVGAYVLFARYTPENGQQTLPVTFHWSVVALLVLVPAWFILRGKSSVQAYDPGQSQATLTALQQRVDSVNAQGGEILFITQRHLVAMKMLRNVTLIPEYEREELMEMAMSDNESYLRAFRTQLEQHRFAAIVVDEPLSGNIVGDDEAMGAENDAWTRYVAKRILCTYQRAEFFPADQIAIYVPQEGAAHCP